MTGLWLSGAISEILALPLIVASMILALAHGENSRFNALGSRPLVWLGEISYSTYLLHFVGWTIYKQFVLRGALEVSVLQLAGFFVSVLLASWLSYRLIEQPARRALSR